VYEFAFVNQPLLAKKLISWSQTKIMNNICIFILASRKNSQHTPIIEVGNVASVLLLKPPYSIPQEVFFIKVLFGAMSKARRMLNLI